MGSSSLLSWPVKVALVRRCAPRFGRAAGAHRLVQFLLGLVKSLSPNPPPDDVTRQLFAALPVGMKEKRSSPFLDENTYPTQHSWQPSLALQREHFDFGMVLRTLFSVGSDGLPTKLRNLRTGDFAQFASNLAVHFGDIKASFPQFLRLMISLGPTSAIWTVAESLTDTANPDSEELVSALILNSEAFPLDMIPISQFQNVAFALDCLSGVLDADKLASVAVAARFSAEHSMNRYSIGSDEMREVIVFSYSEGEDGNIWGRNVWNDESSLDSGERLINAIADGLEGHVCEGGSTDEESRATLEGFSDDEGIMDDDDQNDLKSEGNQMWEDDPWADEEGEDDGGEDW